jgi:hypothetical protein
VNLRRIGAIENALGEQNCRQAIRRIVEPRRSKASVPAARPSRDAIWTKKLSSADQARLTERYAEEFERYIGGALDTPEAFSGEVRNPAAVKGAQLRNERH